MQSPAPYTPILSWQSTARVMFLLAAMLTSGTAFANSVSTTVLGAEGLNNPDATGFELPAGVTFTVIAGGSVDALAGGGYSSCGGPCSYLTDPSGTIVFNNSQGVAFDGNVGDRTLVTGSSATAIDGEPYGALIAEFVPVSIGTTIYLNVGGSGTGGTFTAPAYATLVSLFDNDAYNGDNTGFYSVTLSYVPEPVSLAVFASSLLTLGIARRRR